MLARFLSSVEHVVGGNELMIADLVAFNRVPLCCEIEDGPTETCAWDEHAVFMQLRSRKFRQMLFQETLHVTQYGFDLLVAFFRPVAVQLPDS